MVKLIVLEKVKIFPTILYFSQVFMWVWLKLMVSALSRWGSREAALQKWVWNEKPTSGSKSNTFTHSLFSGTASSTCTKRALPGLLPAMIFLFKHLDLLSVWSELSTLLFIDSLQSLRTFAKYIFHTEMKPQISGKREWNYSNYGRENSPDMWCSVGHHAEMKI